jgi:hypothetical protein
MSDDKAKTVPRHEEDPRDAALDQELDDSFPASDPPQTTQPYVKVGGPYRAHGDATGKAPVRDSGRSRG